MQIAIANNTEAMLPTSEKISALQTEYKLALKTIIGMLDGAKYLWEGERHE